MLRSDPLNLINAWMDPRANQRVNARLSDETQQGSSLSSSFAGVCRRRQAALFRGGPTLRPYRYGTNGPSDESRFACGYFGHRDPNDLLVFWFPAGVAQKATGGPQHNFLICKPTPCGFFTVPTRSASRSERLTDHAPSARLPRHGPRGIIRCGASSAVRTRRDLGKGSGPRTPRSRPPTLAGERTS